MQTLAIIRPEEQLKDSKKIVESFGFRPLAVSIIDIVPLRDPLWPAFLDELKVGNIDYVILTSANGASSCTNLGLNAASIPASTCVVAIGPTTRTALLKEHLRVDLMPSEYSSRGIVQMLNHLTRKNVWVLRSAFGSSELIEGLQNNGATVKELVLYTLKKRCGQPQRDFIAKVTEGDVAGVLFTSAMTVHAFFDCADRTGTRKRLTARLANQLVGAIGKPTAEALYANKVQVNAVPEKATFRELVSTVHLALNNRAL